MTIYPVKPATMFAGTPNDGSKNAQDHLDEWRENEKDYWQMNRTQHGIVRVTAEALSELFFQGRACVGLKWEPDRDTYCFIVEAPEAEGQEGVELPTIDSIFTHTLDQYEVHLVKKEATEE